MLDEITQELTGQATIGKVNVERMLAMTRPPPWRQAATRPEEVAQVVRFLVVEAPDYLTSELISLRGGRL